MNTDAFFDELEKISFFAPLALYGGAIGGLTGAAAGAGASKEHRLRNALVGAGVGAGVGAIGGLGAAAYSKWVFPELIARYEKNVVRAKNALRRAIQEQRSIPEVSEASRAVNAAEDLLRRREAQLAVSEAGVQAGLPATLAAAGGAEMAKQPELQKTSATGQS